MKQYFYNILSCLILTSYAIIHPRKCSDMFKRIEFALKYLDEREAIEKTKDIYPGGNHVRTTASKKG